MVDFPGRDQKQLSGGDQQWWNLVLSPWNWEKNIFLLIC